jgi:uncharacterized protein YkwD
MTSNVAGCFRLIALCTLLISASCQPSPISSTAFSSIPTASTSTPFLPQQSSLPPEDLGLSDSHQDQQSTNHDLATMEDDREFLYSREELQSITTSILSGINVRRTAEGLSPLIMHETLKNVAFSRAEDMVARDYFSHTDPDDGGIPARQLLTASDFSGRLAENLFATTGPLNDVAVKTLEAWFNSPIHRANLMDPSFRYTGLGLMGDGVWWKVTQVFAEYGP